MARRGSPSMVALLTYLCVSQHLLQSASALRAARGAGAGRPFGDFPECKKPSSKSQRAMCEWYHCEHMRQRKKLEHFKDWSLTYDIYGSRKFLKASASRILKAYKFAVRGADAQCFPWGETIGDDFAAWAERLIPEAYRCMRVAMEIQSGSSQSKCKEGFTRQFEKRLMRACAAHFDADDQKKRTRNKKIGRVLGIGVAAAAGMLVLPSITAGAGVIGVAAAIAFHVCKKYIVKKPQLRGPSIFSKREWDEDQPPQSSTSKEWHVKEADEAELKFERQEQQEAVKLEDVEKMAKPSGPKFVDDLIALGDDEPELEDAVAPPESNETVPSWQIVPRTDVVALPDRSGTSPQWQQAAAQAPPSAPWPAFASTNPFAAMADQWLHAAPQPPAYASTNLWQQATPPAAWPTATPTNPRQQTTPGVYGAIAAPTSSWEQAAAVQWEPFPVAHARGGFPAPAGPHRGTEQPKGKDFFADLVSSA